jgi:hypothetical protein
MSWLTSFFFYRREIYNDLAEEMRQHLEEKTGQFMRDGMSREKPNTPRAAPSATPHASKSAAVKPGSGLASNRRKI